MVTVSFTVCTLGCAVADQYATLQRVFLLNVFVLHVKRYESNYGDRIILTPHLSRSLKVIGNDTGRSATCDVQLVIYSNYGSISYRFPDNGDFGRKIRKFLSSGVNPSILRTC